MSPREWIAAYGRAWEEREPEAAAQLFSENAVYRSHRFSEPHVGRAGVAEYWRNATETQEHVRVRFGEPVVEGNRAAVEWWTTLGGDGLWTIAGCLFLRFDTAGLCQELRECWHDVEGHLEPPEGWGR